MSDDAWKHEQAVGDSTILDGLLPAEPPPEETPEPAVVVLGRFQPFHLGHAHLVTAASATASERGMLLRIAVGSTNRPESIDDPWTFDERRDAIEAWALSEGLSIGVVGVPDLGDPLRWVGHAESYHGRPGILVSSEPSISDLYEAGGWPIERIALTDRDDLQGWRIRVTMRMLSTISDEEAVREVLRPTVPAPVIDHLLANDGLRRLAFLGGGGEPVG